MISDKISNCNKFSDSLALQQGNEQYFSDKNNNNKSNSRDLDDKKELEIEKDSFCNSEISINGDSECDLGHFDNNNNSNSEAKLKNHKKLRHLIELQEREQYQQMQKLLQQHVFTPHQLQQLMNHHHSAYLQNNQHPTVPMTMSNANKERSQFHFEATKKQLEQLMQQIQEQLQMNFIQQTHLLQQQQLSPTSQKLTNHSTDKRLSKSPTPSSINLKQKLAFQQQELIQQFQLVQRQYFLHQGGLQPLLLAQQHQQMQSE